MEKINVSNDGFVELVEIMGNDLKVVNTARVSYGKESTDFTDKDAKLLNYLWQHEHTSPFRHCYLTFRLRTPIFVLRQWMKHQIGCSWNEQSARYTELRHGFFKPETWRMQDSKNKQSSAGEIVETEKAFEILDHVYATCEKAYDDLLTLGVCREQARVLLPIASYSECIWTASLQAVLHFLKLRLDNGAQLEIQQYARAVHTITAHHFPETLKMIDF